MNDRFSVGQMSKLHNIPIKTLRYYDEIDLFKPIEVDPDTGYRYYSTEQFKQLDIILYLKTLGLSLKEIKQQITNRDIHDFLETLKEQKEITKNKIKELQMIEKRFDGRIKEIEGTRSIKSIGEPEIKMINERSIIQLQEKIRSFYDLEISLRKLKQEFRISVPIIIGKVGRTISVEEIKSRNYFEHNSVFLLLEEIEQIDTFHEMVKVLPKGKYVCMYYRGDYKDAPEYYDILLKFVENENYTIIGDIMVRTIIDQFISNDKNEFLSEIQIPIK